MIVSKSRYYPANEGVEWYGLHEIFKCDASWDGRL